MSLQPLLIWELARKDLKLFLADRRGAFLCFAIPILLASLFGLVFQKPASGELQRLPVAIVAEGDDPLTRRVAATLLASDRLDAVQVSRQRALELLEARTTHVVVVLPAGLGQVARLPRAPDGPRPEVELLHRPGSTLETRWAEGILTEIILREAARDLLGVAPGLRHTLEQRPFTVHHQPVTGPGGLSLNAYSHSFCGMSLQYLLFWGMDSGLLFLRERRRGIWRRLRAAPVSLGTLLAGKALATTLIALAQLAVTFTFARLVFGVTVTGSPAGFLLMAVAAALLAAATGLLVAALGGTESRARSVSILTILVLSMLGGLWLPSFLLPRWVQLAAQTLPTTWALRGLEGVTWQGMGWVGACRCAGVLLAFSLVFLLTALWGLARAETRPGDSGDPG